MLPANLLPLPMVAELPTCQYTSQAWPPLIIVTVELVVVVSVLPIWKTNTASASPWASSVRAPLSCAADDA